MKKITFGKIVLIASLALSSAATSLAGPVGGPRFNRTNVLAYDTDRYTMSFVAGETARVTVVGDHDTDLDLYVYDENGNEIVSDTDDTDVCEVTWTPRWTGVFIIKVVNRGSVYNNYTIRFY